MTINNEERRKELENLEAEARERNRPRKATREELAEEEGDYGDGLEPPMREGRKRGVGNMGNVAGGMGKAVIVAVLISLFFSYAVVSYVVSGYVNKKDFDSNWQGMVGSVNEAKAGITQSKATLDTAIASIPNMVNNSVSQSRQLVDSLNGKVENFNSSIQSNNSRVNDLTTKLESANRQITDMSAKIASYEEKMTVLENKVADLSTVAVVPPTSSSAVTADVRTISSTIMPTSDTVMAGAIKLTLTNTTDAVVEDVIIDLFIQTDYIVPNSVTSLTGGGTIWQKTGLSSGNMVDFVNSQWGLTLKAGEKKVLYLNYTITGMGTTFLTTYPYGVQFQVETTVI